MLPAPFPGHTMAATLPHSSKLGSPTSHVPVKNPIRRSFGGSPRIMAGSGPPLSLLVTQMRKEEREEKDRKRREGRGEADVGASAERLYCARAGAACCRRLAGWLAGGRADRRGASAGS